MCAKFEPDIVPRLWEELFELIREGKYRPTVFRGREWGLQVVKEGLKALKALRRRDVREAGGDITRGGGEGVEAFFEDVWAFFWSRRQGNGSLLIGFCVRRGLMLPS
ncbi:hypothetical protein BDZ91DRAFT_778872 [Kalaharituber pfeilii]|nr:hypothetical protein BDZ91DRAFT_778872 [Kalaharituber pfeilii]